MSLEIKDIILKCEHIIMFKSIVNKTLYSRIVSKFNGEQEWIDKLTKEIMDSMSIDRSNHTLNEFHVKWTSIPLKLLCESIGQFNVPSLDIGGNEDNGDNTKYFITTDRKFPNVITLNISENYRHVAIQMLYFIRNLRYLDCDISILVIINDNDNYIQHFLNTLILKYKKLHGNDEIIKFLNNHILVNSLKLISSDNSGFHKLMQTSALRRMKILIIDNKDDNSNVNLDYTLFTHLRKFKFNYKQSFHINAGRTFPTLPLNLTILGINNFDKINFKQIKVNNNNVKVLRTDSTRALNVNDYIRYFPKLTHIVNE